MTSLFAPYFFKETANVESSIPDNTSTTTTPTNAFTNAYNVFEDFDALECGDAREFIPYNYLLPSKDWSLCKVYRKSNVSN
jgi:hypothetical protein